VRQQPEAILAGRGALRARALLVGQRIDVRSLERREHIASAPLTFACGEGGYAVCFRHGAVVFFGVDAESERAALEALQPQVVLPLRTPEIEQVDIVIDPRRTERLHADERLVLHDASIERLQTVAVILGKSVALARYEARMADAFESVEPVAAELQRSASMGRPAKELLRQIGDVLRMRHQMVGMVEVIDKPELVWDRPDLDRLYTRLRDEYELADRHRALDRKLDLIEGTVQTVLDLHQDRRSLRVEWYIVILILVEIVITLFDLLNR